MQIHLRPRPASAASLSRELRGKRGRVVSQVLENQARCTWGIPCFLSVNTSGFMLSCCLFYLLTPTIKKKLLESSCCGSLVMNTTSICEDEGSIPGLVQRSLALLSDTLPHSAIPGLTQWVNDQAFP